MKIFKELKEKIKKQCNEGSGCDALKNCNCCDGVCKEIELINEAREKLRAEIEKKKYKKTDSREICRLCGRNCNTGVVAYNNACDEIKELL
jgi:hypothetical protein